MVQLGVVPVDREQLLRAAVLGDDTVLDDDDASRGAVVDGSIACVGSIAGSTAVNIVEGRSAFGTAGRDDGHDYGRRSERSRNA